MLMPSPNNSPRALVLCFVWVLCLACTNSLAAFETRAKAAYVVDLTTNTVLLAKNADTPLPPASMSKLMTLYVAFEFIKSGQLSLDEKLPVSEHAASYKGSTMFLNTTDRVRVEDLLRGIIVLSGNDACAVIAESLSPDGTETGFARLMTQRAQQMGMTNSIFRNSNGWPATGHVMSMRDLALLSRKLIEDFPEFYSLFSERKFLFDGRAPANSQNRNPLLGLDIGADGLKTGHTQEAGYGLTGSAIQGERRIIFAISGLSSAKERAEEAEAIVNWAFRQFALTRFAPSDTALAQVPVWNGAQGTVGLSLEQPLELLKPVLSATPLQFEVEYKSPISAPINKGDVIGTLIASVDGLPDIKTPLVANQDIPVGGFLSRLKTAAFVLTAKLQDRSGAAF